MRGLRLALRCVCIYRDDILWEVLARIFGGVLGEQREKFIELIHLGCFGVYGRIVRVEREDGEAFARILDVGCLTLAADLAEREAPDGHGRLLERLARVTDAWHDTSR
jgi:hypothetical protein